MIYEFNVQAVSVFAAIVGFTLWLSFFLGRRAQSASGFFAAGGGIPWFVNGVAFAGDYLSAASFLGICGMIAFYGYDGFLYSIGYLAGWIVALFVIAEPLKRMGRYTFADALDSQFNSRGIKLAAAISTLVVSIFYLIPQMVGAGALVTPLLGLPHWAGVIMVGTIVIVIVTTAGMVSTTWVQFLKGSLLVIFSAVLTVMILGRGFTEKEQGLDEEGPRIVPAAQILDSPDWTVLPETAGWEGKPFVRAQSTVAGESDTVTVWRKSADESMLFEAQTVTTKGDATFVNGRPRGLGAGQNDLQPVGHVLRLPGDGAETGPQGPLEFFRTIQQSEILLWRSETITHDGATTTVYFPVPTSGADVLSPGNHPSFQGIRGDNLTAKINFLSLMLALFCGTASLPHILIR